MRGRWLVPLLFIAAPGVAVATDPPPAIVVREFVAGEPPTPSCHASTIVETTPGRFVVGWFGGTDEGADDVGIFLSHRDGGEWSRPVEVATGDTPDGGRLPCWNPVLWKRPDGAIVLSYKVGESPQTWHGLQRVSHDGGHGWEPPQRLSRPGTTVTGGPVGPVKNKPLVMADGTILAPSSSEDDGWRVHFERSTDGGASWDIVGPLNDGRAIAAIQPALLVLGPDHVLALGRTRSGRVFRTASADGGRSWSPLELADLPNPSSGLDAVTLRDGRHLLVANLVPEGRTPLAVAMSRDGRTWRTVVTLEDDPGEYSYPAIIQAADGRVHVTYTWRRRRIAHVVIDPEGLTTGDD